MEVAVMRAFKALRGVGLAACAVITLLMVAASAALAASPVRSPFAQQATLTASDEIGHSGLGSAVALSSDGNTALIGGPDDNEGSGAVWVFTRKGSTWTKRAKLTGGGEIGSGKFGTGVALSSDGKTALIGGPGYNGGLGAAWVFTRRGSTWTQRGSKLTGGGEIGQGEFGTSVALSSHANTALIGGPKDNEHLGAAWVFTRSGSTWTQRGPKLTGGGGIGSGRFGASVALSSGGNTALIGGPEDNWEGGHGCAPIFTCAGGPRGAAWVFTRSGSTWTQQDAKLTPTGGGFAVGGVYFGTSVALSADGNTALVGGPLDNWPNEYVGAAWVYTRSGSTWTQQGEKLKNSEPVEGFPDERFGSSVALSSDGDSALIDSEGGGSPAGAWVFTRSGTTWTEQGPTLTCGGEGCDGSLSGGASTALVGTAVYVNAPPHK
jgi:hypothetical protein